ncbi:hypothetical protein GCM10010404_54100 [Nonomuraea africana]
MLAPPRRTAEPPEAQGTVGSWCDDHVASGLSKTARHVIVVTTTGDWSADKLAPPSQPVPAGGFVARSE